MVFPNEMVIPMIVQTIQVGNPVCFLEPLEDQLKIGGSVPLKNFHSPRRQNILGPLVQRVVPEPLIGTSAEPVSHKQMERRPRPPSQGQCLVEGEQPLRFRGHGGEYTASPGFAFDRPAPYALASPRVKNWIIAGLAVALVAVSVGAGVLAQASRTANVEVRVWEDVNDPERNYISARPEGGSWRALGTIPLPLTDGVSSTGRFRYGDITLAVPLPEGSASQPRVTPTPTPTPTPQLSGDRRPGCERVPPSQQSHNCRAGRGEWTAWTSTDELSRIENQSASLVPNTKNWAYSSNDDAFLAVRCKDNIFEVFAYFDEFLGSDNIRVQYRLDSSRTYDQTWSTSTTGTAAFASNPRSIVRGMTEGVRLVIRAYDFRDTPHTMTFNDVRGIENVLVGMPCY